MRDSAFSEVWERTTIQHGFLWVLFSFLQYVFGRGGKTFFMQEGAFFGSMDLNGSASIMHAFLVCFWQGFVFNYQSPPKKEEKKKKMPLRAHEKHTHGCEPRLKRIYSLASNLEYLIITFCI